MTREVMGRRRPCPYGERMTTVTEAPPVGGLLRGWRERRRLSQLELASRTAISARHLSFVETGRSKPTSAMILRLAQQLDVPLREQNELLLSGGFAPAYPTTGLGAPPMAAVNDAINHILDAHEPLPAVVVDAHWDLVAANDAVGIFTAGAAAHLLEPPVNVLRLSLHPDGMAPRIDNLGEWRAHLLARLDRDAQATADPSLRELHDEIAAYPAASSARWPETHAIIVPLRYRHDGHELSFFSTTTVFGTPRDVTVAELAVESFYPADRTTAAALHDVSTATRRSGPDGRNGPVPQQ